MSKIYEFRLRVVSPFKNPMPFVPAKIKNDETLRAFLVSTRIPVTCIPASWAAELGFTTRKIKAFKIDTVCNVEAESVAWLRISFYDESGLNCLGNSEIETFISRDLNGDYGILGSKEVLHDLSFFRICGDRFEFKMRPTKAPDI